LETHGGWWTWRPDTSNIYKLALFSLFAATSRTNISTVWLFPVILDFLERSTCDLRLRNTCRNWWTWSTNTVHLFKDTFSLEAHLSGVHTSWQYGFPSNISHAWDPWHLTVAHVKVAVLVDSPKATRTAVRARVVARVNFIVDSCGIESKFRK